ncbi:MAG: class I SAM-dependent methyltransferase [Kiritimatiellae bacterium]|nr:class I SAM-dependent methyltransferase [Kiritimatiellia bacterium]
MQASDTSCWCGETELAGERSGRWRVAAKDGSIAEVPFVLGTCAACGTTRTIEVGSPVVPVAGGDGIYTELALRHWSSIHTIERHLRGNSIVDIGCNSGLILKALKSRRPELTRVKGLDRNADAVRLGSEPGVELSTGRLADVGESFDNVILVHVLEHVREVGSLFRDIVQALAPGGMIYLCVPNYGSFRARADDWGALNPFQHCWHFTKTSLRRLVTAHLAGYRVGCLKDSWIWPPSGRGRLLASWLREGDQLEMVVEQN